MSRRNMKNKPKRGLGQAITRQRRKAAEAAREAQEARAQREKQAALDEIKRATVVYKESDEIAQKKFASSLFKSVVNGQVGVLRAWGMDHGIKCRTHYDQGVAAWTDFKDVHCYWPQSDVPDRNDTAAVADCIAQIKGVMQHEFGHLRFTTSWREVLDNATYPDRHDQDHRHMMTCWNMLEDERMESLVVQAVPRISRYFGTMVANVILGNTNPMQTWLMLAGRDYLPYNVLEQSYDLFTAWANFQGVPDAGDTWFDLVEDYKAASTHQEIMDAVAAAYDYIKMLNATMPPTIDSHDQQDENETGNDPEDSAKKQRGDILDMFKDPEQGKGKKNKSDKPEPQKEKSDDKSDKPQPPQGGGESDDDSEQGDDEMDGEGNSPGQDGEDGEEEGDQGAGGDGDGDADADEGDESDNNSGGGRDEYGDDNSDDEAEGGSREAEGDDGEPGQSNSGDGTIETQTEQEMIDSLQESVSEMRDEMQESIRNDKDVMEMQWNAQDMAEGEGLPEYNGDGAVVMSNELQTDAETVSMGIKEALNSFLTEAAPQWHSRQDEGVIDPLAYRTKNPGDRDFRRLMTGDGNQGLDVHVSMLCDVSYSMSNGPMQALSTGLYATAKACDDLGIGRTLTLWSSGGMNFTVHPNGQDPAPVIFPAMGGTDPTEALDDLNTHNQEGAGNHLVIIFTDGAWGTNFPNLQRWGGEGRHIVLVRYGTYEGAVQTDMGADEHVAINDVGQLPEKLTYALMDVLASGDL